MKVGLFVTNQQLLDTDTHEVPKVLREESPRFLGVSGIKKFDNRTRRIHASRGIDSWSDAKPEIIGPHLAPIAAAGHCHQGPQAGVLRSR